MNRIKKLALLLGFCIFAFITTAFGKNILSLHPQIRFDATYYSVGDTITVLPSGFFPFQKIQYQWKIDGDIQSTTENQLFLSEDMLESFIQVTAYTQDQQAMPLSFYFSKLPVIYIDTGTEQISKEISIPAHMTIQGNALYHTVDSLYSGPIQIHGRGNTSWNVSPKKPYKIKLDQATDLLNMGENKHWVLISNPYDNTSLRNTLAYELSKAFGLTSMNSTWVSLILDGNYVGMYQLCEQVRISPNRIDIFDWEEFAEETASILVTAEIIPITSQSELSTYLKQDLSWLSEKGFTFQGIYYDISNLVQIPPLNGGVLFELDAYFDEISKFWVYNQPINIAKPVHLNTNSELFQYCSDYLYAFWDAVMSSEDYHIWFQSEYIHYSDLVDMDSLVAYFLVNEIFFNEEAIKKSTFFYKDIDSTIYMGPIWDMDFSSGGAGEDAQRYDQWQTKFYSKDAQTSNFYKSLIKDTYFINAVYEAYWIHRDAIDTMLSNLESYYMYIKESGIANNAVWEPETSYEERYLTLSKWLQNRIHWLDAQFSSLESLTASLTE